MGDSIITAAPKTINIITNVLGVILAVAEPARAYFLSQPFNWVTFGTLVATAIVAYFTSKSTTSMKG